MTVLCSSAILLLQFVQGYLGKVYFRRRLDVHHACDKQLQNPATERSLQRWIRTCNQYQLSQN